MKVTAIVLAGGRGSRMNSDIPKQYMPLGKKPVLYYSLQAFEESPADDIILVAGKEDLDYCRQEFISRFGFRKIRRIVAGGKERYDSVKNGLDAIQQETESDIVLIHDGARPCVSADIILRCIEDARQYRACTAAVPSKDTVKIADVSGFVSQTPDRSSVWLIQTPQAFSLPLLRGAYENMAADINGAPVTDDAMVIERYTEAKVKLTMGGYENIKITTPEDLVLAEKFISGRMDKTETVRA